MNKKFRILDCTLRDGGCVIDFNFGSRYMQKIKSALEDSNIDLIECGYIDDTNGSEMNRTQFISPEAVSDNFLFSKKPNIEYVAMSDLGKFNFNKLKPRRPESIDGIRIAFHKKDKDKITEIGKIILDNGYNLYIQPMITLRYSDIELITLINVINNELPKTTAMYIVDSFGEMRFTDLTRIAYLVDNNLNSEITLGFHSHNNLQLSYSNAIQMLEFKTNRSIMLDVSIMGMGKGAGNLNTEILLDHMNIYYGMNYNIQSLLEVIDQVINQIYENTPWGYSVAYFLSALNRCTPSYASHFFNKHMLTIEQVSELLGKIEEDKKISFDKVYADEIYNKYKAVKFNDLETCALLKRLIGTKQVVLVAPGRSLISNMDKINEICSDNGNFVISLNHSAVNEIHYVFTTKKDEYLNSIKRNKTVFTLANISCDIKNANIFDSKKWLFKVNGVEYDSALYIFTNILDYVGVKRIQLIGFDGFNENLNDNYYDEMLARRTTKKEAENRNIITKIFLKNYSNKINFEFLTESLYRDYKDV